MQLDTEQYYGKIDLHFLEKVEALPYIYRLTGKNGRFYFTRPNPNEDCIIYNSGTTLIGNYRDVSGEEALHKYKVRLINEGKDPAVVLAERQDYGTIMHVIYGDILCGANVPITSLAEYMTARADEIKIPATRIAEVVTKNERELQKDILSLIQWIKDYEVEALAVELMVRSEKHMVATPLDLICNLTMPVKGFWGEVYASGAKKGQPKATTKKVRMRGIVDFKSGKKGFWDKNVLQLLLSKELYTEYFGEEPEFICNFAPKDWKSNYTYLFADQERENKQIDFLKKIAQNVFERGLYEFKYKLRTKKYLHFDGNASIKDNTATHVWMTDVELANEHYDRHHINRSSDLKRIVEDNSINGATELRNYLDKMPQDEFVELAKNSMLGFSSKTDFLEKIEKHYNKWQ